jgi:hypothetical protein
VLTASILGEIKCYNAITLIALAAGTLVISRPANEMPLCTRMLNWPEALLSTWSNVLAWSARSPWTNARLVLRSRRSLRHISILANIPVITLALMALLVSVVVLSVCSHFAHWDNIRLIDSDEYLCMLRSRQLLLNIEVTAKPLLFPALVSGTALLSSADPLHVVRALAAVMPVLITLAIGRVTFLLTHSFLASSIAMYCENVALLRFVLLPIVIRAGGPQPVFADLLTASLPSSLEAETAIFFLLLWMAVLLKRSNVDPSVGRSTLACGVVLLASSVLLLLLAPFVGMACVSKRPRLLLLLGMTVAGLVIVLWQIQAKELPIEALQYLPCMLSLIVGMLVARLEVVAVLFAGMHARPVVAALVVLWALICVPPQIEGTQPLEYDSIARATNVIAHQFTHQRWSIAAPVEQFAEVYSLGDFQDLASLVNSSSSGDISRAMMANDGLDDLFIFVEKVPFTPFQREPNFVSFATLTDSTYRNYRSPAGRASLEVRAMELCEAYKKKHGNMTIFFEDENVRVYRVNRVREVGPVP